MNNTNKLITVVETAEFVKQANKFMTDENRRELINYIAANPYSGDLITGAGGVRKVRWANELFIFIIVMICRFSCLRLILNLQERIFLQVRKTH